MFARITAAPIDADVLGRILTDGSPDDEPALPVRFRLYDDDKILYFEGQADDEDTVEELFFYWGSGWGVTYSETDVGRGWEPFIG